MLFLLILIAAIVFADQLTKWLAVIYLEDVGSMDVILGILKFTYVRNNGAAFGMLGEHRWIFMLLSTVAIIGLLIYLWRSPKLPRLCSISVAFLIGGGIGNMIDRCALGYVIDFIDFCAFPSVWVWVFNVADAFVTVGTAVVMFYLIRATVREFRADRESREPGIVIYQKTERDLESEGGRKVPFSLYRKTARDKAKEETAETKEESDDPTARSEEDAPEAGVPEAEAPETEASEAAGAEDTREDAGDA